MARSNLQIPKNYPCYEKHGQLIDQDGYILVDDLGTALNLMIQEGIEERGGRFIGGFILTSILNTKYIEHQVFNKC